MHMAKIYDPAYSRIIWSSTKDEQTTLFKDNAACIARNTEGYIKSDKIKYISPKFFYTHELQKGGDVDIQQIRSSNDLIDLFTEVLPTSTFKKLIHKIEICRLRDVTVKFISSWGVYFSGGDFVCGKH